MGITEVHASRDRESGAMGLKIVHRTEIDIDLGFIHGKLAVP
jgi:hypothetical protein